MHHRVVEYWFLAFPGTGKFLGEFHMQENGYHRVVQVENEHEAMMFDTEKAIDNMGLLLAGLGYSVESMTLTSVLQ